jgi:hypothetical protein
MPYPAQGGLGPSAAAASPLASRKPRPTAPGLLAGPGRLLLGNLVAALLYAGLGAAVGTFFGQYGLFPAPIWLPAGIAAVACLLGGARLVPGLFLGSFAVNWLLLDASLLTSVLISLSNSLGPLAGALLTRALRPPTGLFTRLRGVLGFVAGCVVLQALLTAAGGTAGLLVAGGLPVEAAYSVFSRWALCEAGGVFFFAPTLLLWMGIERTPASPARRIPDDGTRAAPATGDSVVLAAAAGLAGLVFALPPPAAALVQPEAVVLLTIPVTWITLRISLRAAIARHSFMLNGDEVPARLTASLGVTGLLPGDISAEELLQRADAAVFLAKAKGRNRVELRMVSEAPKEMRASNLSR